jgi:predicted ABC-type ATPase
MGELLLEKGVQYYNPDVFARQLMALDSSVTQEQANSAAWNFGKQKLEAAISRKASYAFETTLGANTIPRLLKEASMAGVEVVMWYCGLESSEKNIQRVAARVAKGGHPIPEDRIRARWNSSRAKLIQLLPVLTEIKILDNSVEATEETGYAPPPVNILHLKNGRIVHRIATPPDWAKPILAAAFVVSREI